MAAGVEHIVYTSFFGAAPDSVFTLGRDHYATEQHIRDSGIGAVAPGASSSASPPTCIG